MKIHTIWLALSLAWGLAWCPGWLTAQAQTPILNQLPPPGSTPSLQRRYPVQPVPINTNRLRGLSQSWAQEQYRLYSLAIQALNRLDPTQPRDQVLATQAFNRQLLLYRSLEMLGGDGFPRLDSPALVLLGEASQELPQWKARMQTAAAYLENSGWVVWEYNLLTRRAEVVSLRDASEARLGSIPLVVLDLQRSHYERPFANDRAAYVQALLNNLNWGKIENELARWGVR